MIWPTVESQGRETGRRIGVCWRSFQLIIHLAAMLTEDAAVDSGCAAR